MSLGLRFGQFSDLANRIQQLNHVHEVLPQAQREHDVSCHEEEALVAQRCGDHGSLRPVQQVGQREEELVAAAEDQQRGEAVVER